MQPYHIFPDEMMKELPGYVSESSICKKINKGKKRSERQMFGREKSPEHF